MSNNSNLNRAKQVKNDEFYTQYSDVEAELSHYWKLLKGKWVYCWCDNPEFSQFWAYLKRNFRAIGLKRLTSTYYVPKGHPLRTDMYANGRIVQKPMEGDGDFRGPEAQGILQECDVVITNPPFSLIREMIPNILDAGKKMIILGPVTASTNGRIYDAVLEGRLWTGYNHGNNTAFDVPKGFKRSDVYVGEDGRKKCDIGNIVWYTNLGRPQSHEGFGYDADYQPRTHKLVDGTDIVNVDALKDVPSDYYGPVAVPVTAVPKLDRKRYELVSSKKALEMTRKVSVDGEQKFKRVVVQRIPGTRKSRIKSVKNTKADNKQNTSVHRTRRGLI